MPAWPVALADSRGTESWRSLTGCTNVESRRPRAIDSSVGDGRASDVPGVLRVHGWRSRDCRLTGMFTRNLWRGGAVGCVRPRKTPVNRPRFQNQVIPHDVSRYWPLS